jgi:hypothetical protein
VVDGVGLAIGECGERFPTRWEAESETRREIPQGLSVPGLRSGQPRPASCRDGPRAGGGAREDQKEVS